MRVLITDMRHPSIEEERKVLEPAGVTIETSFCRTEEELIREGQGAFAFLVSLAPVTRRVMEQLPDLRLIVRYGVGVDNVDVEAARELGKMVARVPDYCADEVAAHTLALILAGLRMLFPLTEAVKSGRWVNDPSSERLRRPTTLNAGIVGCGRIGRRVAKLLQPLVARILFYDPYVSATDMRKNGGEPVRSIPELAASCQILSLHAPLNEETRDIVDGKALACADGLILINTSRADLIHREALETALHEGRVSFFGSDVFWQEPPDYSDPGTIEFLSRREVLATPHMAWYSEESERELRRKAAEEILRFLRGEQLLNIV
ncbi:MAG: C-terminal binding protein [Spirochaetaceae bacterium]|nr:MAG: C-terminal binding protein [Spirochaetaceae bacterium]